MLEPVHAIAAFKGFEEMVAARRALGELLQLSMARTRETIDKSHECIERSDKLIERVNSQLRGAPGQDPLRSPKPLK